MAATPNKFSLAAGMGVENLQVLFAKMSRAFYSPEQITAANFGNKGLELAYELPILEDSLNFDMGQPEKTETKLTSGIVWVSRANKGDSDISFQVASLAGVINDTFMNKRSNVTLSGVQFTNGGAFGIPEGNTYAGVGYSDDVKKVTGSLIFLDDNAQTVIVLPNIEAYAGLVVGEGDNPAYFNVSVTPKLNADGVNIIPLTLTTGTQTGGFSDANLSPVS